MRPWVSSLAVHAYIYTITTSKINYLTFDIYHNMNESGGLILGDIRQACRSSQNNRDNVEWWPEMGSHGLPCKVSVLQDEKFYW